MKTNFFTPLLAVAALASGTLLNATPASAGGYFKGNGSNLNPKVIVIKVIKKIIIVKLPPKYVPQPPKYVPQPPKPIYSYQQPHGPVYSYQQHKPVVNAHRSGGHR